MPNSKEPFFSSPYVTSQSTPTVQVIGIAPLVELERSGKPTSQTTSEASAGQQIVEVNEIRYGTGKPRRIVVRGKIARE